MHLYFLNFCSQASSAPNDLIYKMCVHLLTVVLININGIVRDVVVLQKSFCDVFCNIPASVNTSVSKPRGMDQWSQKTMESGIKSLGLEKHMEAK